MPSATALRGMLRTDALRMFRDKFLIGTTLYILFVFVLMRAAIPWLTGEILSNWAFDLSPYHPLIVSHFAVQLAPWVPGIIGGFLLLESREDGTVKALLVSPTPLSSYVAFACVAMYLSALCVVVVAAVIIGRGLPPWLPLLFVGLAAAPAGPALALLVAAVSNNKVQAFAYMKLFGIGPLIGTGCYFLPTQGQWLAAIYPPYCASKAFWCAEAGDNHWPYWIAAGLCGSGIWMAVLWRMFLNAARK